MFSVYFKQILAQKNHMHAVHVAKKISYTAEKLHAHVHVNQRNDTCQKTKFLGQVIMQVKPLNILCLYLDIKSKKSILDIKPKKFMLYSL